MGVVGCWRRRADVALAAGLLLAVNPLHIWYSQETRAYALMLFFGLLSLLCYEMARQTCRARWWAGYVVAALVAIALHRTAIIFPAACSLWHGWDVQRKRDKFRMLFIHAAILAIAVFALSPKSFPPAPEYGRPSSVLELLYTILTYLGGYSLGPSLASIQTYGPWVPLWSNGIEWPP